VLLVCISIGKLLICLTYSIIFSLIKLKHMKKLLLLGVLVLAVFSTSMAQTRQVTGKVTASEDGTALPGVSVSLKGHLVVQPQQRMVLTKSQ
jgi:hypothetical protein